MNTPSQRMEWIRHTLTRALGATKLKINDDSDKHKGHEGAKGGAGHYTVEISSPLFANKSLIECHRLVYQALESAIPQEIHALKIKIIKE